MTLTEYLDAIKERLLTDEAVGIFAVLDEVTRRLTPPASPDVSTSA